MPARGRALPGVLSAMSNSSPEAQCRMNRHHPVIRLIPRLGPFTVSSGINLPEVQEAAACFGRRMSPREPPSTRGWIGGSRFCPSPSSVRRWTNETDCRLSVDSTLRKSVCRMKRDEPSRHLTGHQERGGVRTYPTTIPQSTVARSEPIIFWSSMTREPFFRECRLLPMRG
jgi:hypothetical protein